MSTFSRNRILGIAVITGLLSACANTNVAVAPKGVVGDVADATAKATQSVFGASIIPNSTLSIGPSVSYPVESLVYWGIWVGAAYLILDPFAPNWEIQEARFPDNHVHLALTMKRYYAGGAGEARMIFHRRAKELMRAGGYTGYEVVEYAEGLESSVIGSQRNAIGVVRFSRSRG